MKTERQFLILVKEWNEHQPGEVFGVLLPGEDPAPGLIDSGRAAQLLADRKAERQTPAVPETPIEDEDKPAKTARGKGAKNG